MEAEKDTDWFFDWPTGYVRYRNGRREALQDRGTPPSRPLLTDEEREAIQWAVRQADRMEMYLERQIEPDKESPHITAEIAAHAARRKVLEEMLCRRA